MPASACCECPFRKQCPIENTRDGKFTLEFTDKERRLAGRRVEEATAVYKERYAPRSGIESTNSGLKNRLDLGRLRVRGRGSVFRVLRHKVAGWNVLRAAASAKLARGCRPKWPGPSKGANLGRLSSLSPPFLGCGRRSRPYLGFIETVSTVFRPHAPLEENRAADYRRSSGMVQTQVTAQGCLGSTPEGRRPQIRGWRAGGSLAVSSPTPATPLLSPAKIRELNHAEVLSATSILLFF